MNKLIIFIHYFINNNKTYKHYVCNINYSRKCYIINQVLQHYISLFKCLFIHRIHYIYLKVNNITIHNIIYNFQCLYIKNNNNYYYCYCYISFNIKEEEE